VPGAATSASPERPRAAITLGALACSKSHVQSSKARAGTSVSAIRTVLDEDVLPCAAG